MGVDEVEALAHEGFFEVEDHAVEIDEALWVDEDTDRRGFCQRRVEVRLSEGVNAVALAGLSVELDVVAEAGAAASGDAEAEATGVGGDVLFAGGVGRWDLPGGDAPQLFRGIKEKLFPLGDDVIVLPGHGPPTKIGEERKTNPFVH